MECFTMSKNPIVVTGLAEWRLSLAGFLNRHATQFLFIIGRSFLCICLNIMAEADIYEVPITLVNRVNRISHVFRSKSLRLH